MKLVLLERELYSNTNIINKKSHFCKLKHPNKFTFYPLFLAYLFHYGNRNVENTALKPHYFMRFHNFGNNFMAIAEKNHTYFVGLVRRQTLSRARYFVIIPLLQAVFNYSIYAIFSNYFINLFRFVATIHHYSYQSITSKAVF